MVAGGLTIVTVGLDVTFIVATATGLTYEDEGWAIAQVVWASASSIGAAIGFGYGLDADFPGLAGAMVLIGAGSGVLLGYAIDALVRGDEGASKGAMRRFWLGAAPTNDGLVFTLGWQT